MAESPHDPESLRSAATILENLSDGEVHHDFTEGVREAVARMHDVRRESGGKPRARITLQIDMTLDGDSIDVIGEVKLTLPKVKKKRTVFYATPSNLLTRRNPRQGELPLRTVSNTPPDAPRAIGGSSTVRTI